MIFCFRRKMVEEVRHLLKIVFLVTNFGSGGSERTVAYLTDFFAQKGWDVTLMTTQDGLFYELDPRVHCVTLGIPYVSLSVKTAHKWLYNYFRRKLLVPKAIRKVAPDVVFCMIFKAATYLSAKRRRDYCLISSERTLPSASSPRSLQKKIEVFSQCDAVIFQTIRAMEFYPSFIQERGKVIPNAIGNPYVAQAVRPAQRKKKISAMGRLSSEKDYPTLLRAFAIVHGKHASYRLEIYGEGSQKTQLLQLAQELGIGDAVDFCGADPKAILHIADAACYVLSSKYEGMPNALMEAMAVGLPCVATDCPNGPAELIRHGENGLLVPVGNVEKLSAAILRMIEDTTFAEGCGERAMELRYTHSMEKMAQKYMDYIEEALERRNRQPSNGGGNQ